jgi:hypothetical protein
MSSTVKHLINAAKSYNALPLLVYVLGKENIQLDEESHSLYRKQYIRNCLSSAILLRELETLLIRLKERGIDVILLKGAAFCTDLYSDPGIRPMRDIDLLIHKKDLSGAIELFFASDYRRSIPVAGDIIEEFHGEITFVKETNPSIIIEPHWMLSPEYAYSCKVDTEGLWQRSRRARLAGINTLVLCTEDVLLHICLHLFLHSRSMWLVNACDIDSLIRYYNSNIDWDVFLARVVHYELCLPVRYSLNTTVEALGSPVPDFVLKELATYKAGRLELSIAHILMNYTGAFGPESLATLLTIRGIRQKIRYLYAIFFPSREWLASRYSVSSTVSLVLYTIHICNVLLIGMKGLVQLISGSVKSTGKTEKTISTQRDIPV